MYELVSVLIPTPTHKVLSQAPVTLRGQYLRNFPNPRATLSLSSSALLSIRCLSRQSYQVPNCFATHQKVQVSRKS